MSRLYLSFNKIKFTHISENYQIPRTFKNKLSPLYSNVITYVVSTYNGTMKYKTTVVKIINILTYAVFASEPLPFTWSASNPFINIPEIDDDQLEEVLGDLYLTEDAIDWDIKIVDESSNTYNTFTPVSKSDINKPILLLSFSSCCFVHTNDITSSLNLILFNAVSSVVAVPSGFKSALGILLGFRFVAFVNLFSEPVTACPFE